MAGNRKCNVLKKHPLIDELAKGQYEVGSRPDRAGFTGPWTNACSSFATLVARRTALFDRLDYSANPKAGVATAYSSKTTPRRRLVHHRHRATRKAASGGFMEGRRRTAPKGAFRRLMRNGLEVNVPGSPAAQGMIHPELAWQRATTLPALPKPPTNYGVASRVPSPLTRQSLRRRQPDHRGIDPSPRNLAGATKGQNRRTTATHTRC